MPPFFCAFHALAVDDGRGGAGFPFALLPALQIKRLMNAIQRSVPTPQIEIIMHRAARWQIFRECTPLTSRAQNIHHPVHHFTHIDMAPVTPTFGRGINDSTSAHSSSLSPTCAESYPDYRQINMLA